MSAPAERRRMPRWQRPLPWLLLALGLGLASLLRQGPLPGDVELMRALQRASGADTDWAQRLTGFAKLPGVLVSLLAATVLAGLRGGARALRLPLLGYLLALVLDRGLRVWVHVPRPFDDGALLSSSLPSTFGLVFGALFGAVLVTPAKSGPVLAGPAAALALALLVAGFAARITLAGHWPSQMLASYALAFAAVLAVAPLGAPR